MATRGLKPRGRTVTLAFDEGIVGLVGRLAEPINLADAQKHPSFKYIPSVKEERFRAFLGVPIIQRRQFVGVLVVQQRELRQYDESEATSGDACYRDGSYSFSVAVDCLVWAISPDANPRITGSTWCAIAKGRQDATLPLMEQVYQTTLDPALERERLTGALEEAQMSFAATASCFAAGAQKRNGGYFRFLLAPAFGHPATV